MKDIVENKLTKKQSRIFVLSFSFNYDSLHLWNCYGKDDGYAMGFNLSELLKSLLNKNKKLKINDKFDYAKYSIYYGKVVYDEKEFKILLETIIYAIIDILKILYTTENRDKQLYLKLELIKLENLLIASVLNMKYKPHYIEEEYRITIIPDDDYIIIEYINKNGLITPCIEMKFDNIIPIRKMVIGPKINDEAAKLGLDTLLKAYNYEIKDDNIIQSKLSIRP